MVLTARPGEAMASPETLEALEECRARIEILSHVNKRLKAQPAIIVTATLD